MGCRAIEKRMARRGRVYSRSYLEICLEVMREPKYNFSQNTWCLGRESNRALAELKYSSLGNILGSGCVRSSHI
jgi:hypothetical protein